MPNVVIYARVSTDLQKIRGSAESQIATCRRLIAARSATLLGVFVDEAISGSVPLRKRPSGRRMLQLCATGAVNAVVVARLDRLSRRLDDVTGELNRFSGFGLEIWSVPEGDVSHARNITLLAQAMQFAELEIQTLTDRMMRGRDHAAQLGKWTNGPVPFGYDLDDLGYLMPSARNVAGETEADLARSVFMAIANGSSTVAEARRVQALGALPGRRYSGRIAIANSAHWTPSRVNAMIKNPLYAGVHEFSSRFGAITRPVPPLVDQTTWDAAQRQLTLNRGRDVQPAREYLLRGLVFCGACGCRFGGTRQSSGNWVDYYYRCNGDLGAVNPEPVDRCRAKHVPAVWLEDVVWQRCVGLDAMAASCDGFASRRAVVERQVRRVTVHTTRINERSKAAIVDVAFADGSRLVQEIRRRPRSKRAS
ncbi:MAG TPA: recombinase family protein [Methylomirabilota bacterium]|nr:recombinase family protein [Methylomirabilota bacterium]